jgi:hypothetical protein
MTAADWFLLAAGVALGVIWARRGDLLIPGALLPAVSPQGTKVDLVASDLINPGSARSKSPADQSPSGVTTLGSLNAAPGADPYASIFPAGSL